MDEILSAFAEQYAGANIYRFECYKEWVGFVRHRFIIMEAGGAGNGPRWIRVDRRAGEKVILRVGYTSANDRVRPALAQCTFEAQIAWNR